MLSHGHVETADGTRGGDPHCLLLSDVHLGPRARPELARALCELVRAHRDWEVIFVGDTFEFSAIVDPDPEHAWDLIKRANPEVMAVLCAHVAAGGRLTFVVGNHDAALSALSDRFATEFGGREQVSVVPWFTRRGHVHLEHGNLWDRDNAPLHPLAVWRSTTEPLGIALMRRFCAKCNAIEFAHAHQTTPAGGLARAFRLFGFRAPLVVVSYFLTAWALCFEALLWRKRQSQLARIEGSQRASLLAEQWSIEPERLRRLLELAPVPTHGRFATTFMRLYFDRVLIGIACLWALVSVAAAGPTGAGVGVLVLGSGYLWWGSRRGVARYPGPVEALHEASLAIARDLRAQVVVFGHTHVEQSIEQAGSHYINLGSFAYSHGPGRPYALIEGERVSSRRWP